MESIVNYSSCETSDIINNDKTYHTTQPDRMTFQIRKMINYFWTHPQ